MKVADLRDHADALNERAHLMFEDRKPRRRLNFTLVPIELSIGLPVVDFTRLHDPLLRKKRGAALDRFQERALGRDDPGRFSPLRDPNLVCGKDVAHYSSLFPTSLSRTHTLGCLTKSNHSETQARVSLRTYRISSILRAAVQLCSKAVATHLLTALGSSFQRIAASDGTSPRHCSFYL